MAKSDEVRRVPIYLTFDVDAHEGRRFAQPGGSENANISDLSLGRYGVVRGLPRILSLLGRLNIPATFFVPGATVDAHPAAIEQIARGGHEIAHHGYHHFAPTTISEAQQQEEIDRGIEAIERCIGVRPLGYRAPAWALTLTTLRLLCERDFLYDSSAMGDDRPYLERAGEATLREIPVHWSLDDFPYFGAALGYLHPQREAATVFDAWQVEIESAIREDRPTGFYLHPEVIGRALTFAHLEHFLQTLSSDVRVSFQRCADIAALPLDCSSSAARFGEQTVPAELRTRRDLGVVS
jgi:peptidoglycan-N-acetylglucosamine deacetylase